MTKPPKHVIIRDRNKRAFQTICERLREQIISCENKFPFNGTITVDLNFHETTVKSYKVTQSQTTKTS